jgi:exonuclease III
LRIISINLRKRLTNPHCQCALLNWLSPLQPTLLAVQEPIASKQSNPEQLAGLHLLFGTEDVACWVEQGNTAYADDLQIPGIVVEIEGIVVCITYLSSERSSKRVSQLQALRSRLLKCKKPIVLVGDFNLAPSSCDGLYGEATSPWTKKSERIALAEMTRDLDLVDLTSPDQLGQQQFTFERINKGKWTRFRCDLAFARRGTGATARYDHSVRLGSQAFTDHSACVVEYHESSATISFFGS